MVQGVSNLGVSHVVFPAKPAQQQVAPQGSAGLEAGAPPAQAPGGGRAVEAVQPADAEKRQPEHRVRTSGPAAAPGTNLSIAHDDAANRFVYRGVDQASREVKVQWPTEEALRRIAMLREMSGKFLDEVL